MDHLTGAHDNIRELSLFSGCGGGILGGHLLGWRTVCAVEVDEYATSVLVARQNDKTLGPFPIWDDVRTFDGYPWRGVVDVVSGGFPCQGFSVAGAGKGFEDERSGLWTEMARIIREVGPRYAFVENSAALTVRGLGQILADLAEGGRDGAWAVLGACDVGAPHFRKRMWVLANANGNGCKGQFGADETREADAIERSSSASRLLSNAYGLREWQPKNWADQWERTGDCCQNVLNASLQQRTIDGCSAPESGRICEDDTDPNSQRRAQREGQRNDDGTQRMSAERSCGWPAEPGVG